jgi:hypothetical protein
MTPNDIEMQTAAYLHKLGNRHAHISFALIALLALVMGIGGFFGYRAFQSATAAITAAQQQGREYQQQFQQHEAQRTETTKEQKVIVKVIHDRDVQADQKIEEVTKPDADTETVKQNVIAAYQLNPARVYTNPEPGGMFSFGQPEVQLFTATKIDRDRLFRDWQDSQHNLGLEQGTTKSLREDLSSSKELTAKWESAAHKSVKRKVFDGFVHGLELAGTAYVSYKLGQKAH